MPQLWDAESVLLRGYKVDDCWCIGFAPSQGRRCHNRTNNANRTEAKFEFRDLGRLDPRSREARRKIKDIPDLLLCWRHGAQSHKIASEWRAIMNGLRLPQHSVEQESIQNSNLRAISGRPSTTASTTVISLPIAHQPIQLPTPPETPPSARRTNQTRTTSSLQTRSPSLANTAVSSEAVSLNTSIATTPDVRQALDTLLHAVQQSDHSLHPPAAQPSQGSRPDSPTSESVITSSVNEPSEGDETLNLISSTTSSVPDTSSIGLPQSPATPSPRRPQRPTIPPPATSSTLDPSGNASTAACTLQHARRHALPESCSICYEPMELGQPLSWCKQQCGQNFHRECWQACQSNRCPYCRANWAAEACAHDEQAPVVGPVTIRRESDLQGISVAEIFDALPLVVRSQLLAHVEGTPSASSTSLPSWGDS